MLSLPGPSPEPAGYSSLNRLNHASNTVTEALPQQENFWYSQMRSSPRREREILKGIPHKPFEEFALKKVEELVAQLEKARPKEARVEVTPMEESHHVPCMQEMTAVMVQDPENAEGTPQVHALYQYCPVCQMAVRVL